MQHAILFKVFTNIFMSTRKTISDISVTVFIFQF